MGFNHSLEKIRELLDKSALDENDELCSGNGYWISVKEVELVEKYITNGEPQGFNPVSEAPDDTKGLPSSHQKAQELLEQPARESELVDLKKAKNLNSIILYLLLVLSLSVGLLAFYYRKMIILNLVN